MERAQAGAVRIRQHAAAVGAGDHRHPGIGQLFHRRRAADSPAAQPQQRSFRLSQLRPQRIDNGAIGVRRRGRFQRGGHQRGRDFRALNINRDLNRYRPARRRLRLLNRLMQDSQRLAGVADAVRALRAGLQEGQLVAGFVNKAGVGIEPGFST